MKTNLVVLCWLAVVAIVVAGCATGRNKTVEEAATAGKLHTVHKLILLPQKKEALPFSVRKAKYLELFTENDLVPAIVVSNHLEVLAKEGRIPLRVREGFLIKEKRYWYLIEWPAERVYRPPCVGYNIYHIVDLKVMR